LPEAPPGSSGSPRSGFICSDKPAGVTSHDVVARYRRELGLKTGHAGTLDPFATGLLVVLLGSATRLQRYVLGLPKTYVATARLGWTSTTGDPDGELTETRLIPSPEELVLPTGRIMQRPPMTSAVRIDGERLYKKARRGEEVERPEREVEVYRADLIETGDGTATFEIECSAGTYVRTLIEELGDAYCESLRRTRIGELTLPAARSDADRIRPPGELVGYLPAIELDADAERLVRNGIRIEVPEPAAAEAAGEGPVRLIGSGGLVAIATTVDGRLVTEVVLPREDDAT
jgi:tRNA pseudouridine55 synthase